MHHPHTHMDFSLVSVYVIHILSSPFISYLMIKAGMCCVVFQRYFTPSLPTLWCIAWAGWNGCTFPHSREWMCFGLFGFFLFCFFPQFFVPSPAQLSFQTVLFGSLSQSEGWIQRQTGELCSPGTANLVVGMMLTLYYSWVRSEGGGCILFLKP